MRHFHYYSWFEMDGEEEYWVAKASEFPGISGVGVSREEALSELDAILEATIAHLHEIGRNIPEPYQELSRFTNNRGSARRVRYRSLAAYNAYRASSVREEHQ